MGKIIERGKKGNKLFFVQGGIEVGDFSEEEKKVLSLLIGSENWVQLGKRFGAQNQSLKTPGQRRSYGQKNKIFFNDEVFR